jgi:glycosyltransferase involved in cell wall biosynthesis
MGFDGSAMNILLVSNYQWPHLGGIEIIAGELKKAWGRQGHRVTWATTDIPAGAVPSSPENVRLPAVNWLEDRVQINTPLLNPMIYGTVRKLVKAHDAVSVHSLAPGLTSMVARAALSERKRLVVTQQVSVIPLKSKLLTLVQEHLILRAARRCVDGGGILTFVSDSIREWFARHARLDPRRLCTIPNAYDKQAFYVLDEAALRTASEALALPSGKLKVLFVGRFVDKKGLPLIEQLARRYTQVHFTMVGTGVIRPEAWGLANVRVVPPQSAELLRGYYASHDLLILPSIGEGWPLVICEAMACGTPCLISRDTFEKLNRNEEMFLVAENDVSSLARCLDAALAGNIGLMGARERVSRYARDTWDWDRTAAVLADLLASTS